MSTRLAASVLAVLVLAGCTADPPPVTPSGAGAPTGDPVTDLAACPVAGTSAAMADLPVLEFPCLAGGSSFTVGDAPGEPTVLSLWATWCPPCRTELPLFQQLSEAGGQVRVVGLVERDTAASSLAYAAKVGITFPVGLDADGDVMAEQGLIGLPVTYFVAADGSLAFTRMGPVPDYATLQALVLEHLGVRVP